MICLILFTVPTTILDQKATNKDISAGNSPWSYQIRLEYTDPFLLLVKKQVFPWSLFRYSVTSMRNQTAKFRKGSTRREEVLWVVSHSPNVTTSVGHSGPVALPAQGRWLPHPVASGLLAEATGICSRESHTLPGSKVVISLTERKQGGFSRARIMYSTCLKAGTQQGQPGHRDSITGCRQEKVRITGRPSSVQQYERV